MDSTRTQSANLKSLKALPGELLCTQCRRANHEDRVFCGFCGGQLQLVCSKCGHGNAQGTPACGRCGQVFGGSRSASSDPVGALLDKYGLNSDDALRAKRRRTRKLREWLMTKGLVIFFVVSLGVAAVVAIVAWSRMTPPLPTTGGGTGAKKPAAGGGVKWGN